MSGRVNHKAPAQMTSETEVTMEKNICTRNMTEYFTTHLLM